MAGGSGRALADRQADPVCEKFKDALRGSDRAAYGKHEGVGLDEPGACRRGGRVIAERARILAARQLGIAEVPVMVARGWTDAQNRKAHC